MCGQTRDPPVGSQGRAPADRPAPRGCRGPGGGWGIPKARPFFHPSYLPASLPSFLPSSSRQRGPRPRAHGVASDSADARSRRRRLPACCPSDSTMAGRGGGLADAPFLVDGARGGVAAAGDVGAVLAAACPRHQRGVFFWKCRGWGGVGQISQPACPRGRRRPSSSSSFFFILLPRAGLP